MRSVFFAACLFACPAGALAQLIAPPTRLAEVEFERSRACVGTLAEVAAVDVLLGPLVLQGQRISSLAQAVALEDRSGVEPFDASNPVDARVRDWFVTDGALAQRYVAQPAPPLLNERAAGRETIKAFIAESMTGVQGEANAVLETNQDLMLRAGPCDGAIFVRSAVMEACETESGPICEQAALQASEVRGFRFVDNPENIWDIQEMRPWTAPGPLQAGANGQLDGARTIGFARVGNVVVTVAFSPLFQDRAEASPEELASYDSVNDSLGFTFDHPVVAMAPALAIRAALPAPLSTETEYILHFGTPDAPDVLWAGPAGTGRPLEAAIPMAAAHVVRLQAGEPITLTALGSGDQPEYSIEMSSVNQSEALLVLLNYMTTQLPTDLAALVQPRGQ